MKKINKIIVNNLIAIFNLKIVVSIILLYINVNFITKGLYNIKNFNELIKFSFYGTIGIGDLPIEMLKFTAIQMFIIYIALNFINEEFGERIKLNFLRVHSRKMYINSMIITIFVSCFIYFLLGLIVLGLLNLNLITTSVNFTLIIKILFLLIISSFCICLVGFLIALIIKYESVVFTIVLLFYYIGISIESNLTKYIIFTQGILSKHYYHNISFKWSYCYCLFFSVILSFVLKSIFIRRDLV
ncbi:hypothetical protein [Haloimpatiens massiliensis]|uniref:hypothetical protein n=1 Tax=Haloimpatiens massiliensis TaxID=1658110 RepID=UPI000C81F74D|nr:hypothetical protein [Haloimpatiens massiliensis]